MKHQRQIQLAGIPACVVTLLAVDASVQAAHGPGAEVFYDDFEDNDPHDGSPVTWIPDPALPGDYIADSGDYVFTDPRADPQGPMRSTVPEHVLGNTSIRAQVRAVFGGTIDVRVVLLETRNQPATGGTYWGGWFNGPSGNVLLIGRTDTDGTVTTLESEPTPLDLFAEDTILQFDAIGSDLSLSAWPADEAMPGAPQVTTTDATFASGVPGLFAQVGLPISNPDLVNKIRFRWVSVTPEPATAALLMIGSVAVLRRRRRRPLR